MGLTMNKILEKFDDCDMFSLTGPTLRRSITISEEEYNKRTKKLSNKEKDKFIEQFIVTEKYNITEEEFSNALKKIENKTKENFRKIYENNKEKFINYPNFDNLYEEIKQECYDFDCEENRKKYNKDRIKNFFRCSYIADYVGKTTKYGNEYKSLFWNLYHDIASMIDRQKLKKEYCTSNGKNPVEQLPDELKEHLLYYEISFSNSVTISGGLMINYYFKLNNETKKYLLKFRNDFELKGLDDLTIYKNNKEKFYSCTHEKFNSIEFDYKDMTNDEIIDFINDEYKNETNNEVINIVNRLINMEVNTKFTFKELGINDKTLMNEICYVCDKINLLLVLAEEKEHPWATISETGNFEKVNQLPACLCNIDDLIEKTK